MNKKQVVLVVLDGFGISPVTEGNAVYAAKTPILDFLLANFPNCLLSASGAEVGLEWGEMGNSEVGHFNLGTGRVVMQDYMRVKRSIEDGSFFANEALVSAVNHVKKNNSTLHLLGLLSNGAVHAHIDHLLALLDFCHKHKVGNVVLHLITDGRDTPPRFAGHLLNLVAEKIKKIGNKNWRIATLIGRFWAMDRDGHWERTSRAYDLICSGKGTHYPDYASALKDAYDQNISDEELFAAVLDNNSHLEDDDAVICFNIRRDRSRQIVKSIIDPFFKHFERKKTFNNLLFVGFVNFGLEPTSKMKTAFFSGIIHQQLSEILEKNKLTHLHIAETEKYAHVTYFFNGGREDPYEGETRILIPSLRVISYRDVPQMSANRVAKRFIDFYRSKKPNFTILNFANPDMVGHTGNLPAAIKAIETVDGCLKGLISSLDFSTTTLFITADHGNAEQMINPETKEIDKEHTTNPVPFVIIKNDSGSKIDLSGAKQNPEVKLQIAQKQPIGVLADVTATILDVLELKKPTEMTGSSIKDSL